MKKILLIILVICGIQEARSQAVFLRAGKVEFERKTNTHRLYFSEEADAWGEEIKKLIPQFKTDFFDLIFSDERALYQVGKEPEVQKASFFESPASNNTVYKDLKNGKVVSQKQVFEQMFLLTDSAVRFKWKIEPETRTIAGYECRKAVTRICDSVVVVAFYAEEIIPSHGPESFHGLPGMILGLAIPRLYTTWFATKVETLGTGADHKIQPPLKGKKATEKEMTTSINDGIKHWGAKYLHRAIWFARL